MGTADMAAAHGATRRTGTLQCVSNLQGGLSWRAAAAWPKRGAEGRRDEAGKVLFLFPAGPIHKAALGPLPNMPQGALEAEWGGLSVPELSEPQLRVLGSAPAGTRSAASLSHGGTPPRGTKGSWHGAEDEEVAFKAQALFSSPAGWWRRGGTGFAVRRPGFGAAKASLSPLCETEQMTPSRVR